MFETKRFLGKGLSFPVMTMSDGNFKMAKYEEDIQQSLGIILSCPKGSRLMRSSFGCDIHKYIFESINESVVSGIKSSIREALTAWEPRIELMDIRVSTHDIDNGKLIIEIEYVISATNNRGNFVYDFYLREG